MRTMRWAVLMTVVAGTGVACGQTAGTNSGAQSGTDVSQSAPLNAAPADSAQAVDRAATPFSKDDAQISIELRILTGPVEHFDGLNTGFAVSNPSVKTPPAVPEVNLDVLNRNNGIQLVSAQRIVKEKQPVFIRRLNDAGVRQFIVAAQSNKHCNVSFAPKVTLFDGQVANVADIRERPFVVGVKPVGKAMQPVIELESTGTNVNLRAKTLPDSVKLDLAIDLSDVNTVQVRKGGPDNAKVQVPTVASTQIALSALVQNGETLVISGLQHTQEARQETRKFGVFKNVSVGQRTQALIIMITPRVLTQAAVGRVRLDADPGA